MDDAPTAPQGCPNGYNQHGDNCYLLSLDRATYNTAVSSPTQQPESCSDQNVFVFTEECWRRSARNVLCFIEHY